MEKVIIIKYGELSTKKDNINYFLSCLKDNIRNSIGEDGRIVFDRGRMFIYSSLDKYDDILDKLKYVFGIHEINLGYKIDGNDLEDIESSLKEFKQNPEEVKVRKQPQSQKKSKFVGKGKTFDKRPVKKTEKVEKAKEEKAVEKVSEENK